MFNLNWILDKIPRPDRSGVEGALFAIMILGEILAPSYLGEDAFCGILPWQCKVEASEPNISKYITTLIYTENGKGPADDQAHCDWRESTTNGHGMIDHMINERDYCGDAEHDGKWAGFLLGEGHIYQSEVRWHKYKSGEKPCFNLPDCLETF